MTIEYHEPPEELAPETRDLHRAFCTLVEELEAIDWYLHRLDVSGDRELKAMMKHNHDEECEHAAMALEYLRRRVPPLDHYLREYLFTDGPIVEIDGHDHGHDHEGEHANGSNGSLDLGALPTEVKQ